MDWNAILTVSASPLKPLATAYSLTSLILLISSAILKLVSILSFPSILLHSYPRDSSSFLYLSDIAFTPPIIYTFFKFLLFFFRDLSKFLADKLLSSIGINNPSVAPTNPLAHKPSDVR